MLRAFLALPAALLLAFAAHLAPACAQAPQTQPGADKPKVVKPTPDNPSAFELGRNGKVKHSVPLAKVRRGIGGRGDPRDKIPPIYKPKFEPVARASWRGSDRVLVFTNKKITRAYPIKVLNRHEIVNDTLGEQHVAIVFCPLCGTGTAFDRNLAGAVRTFGVSGYLYQSNVVMWDNVSESFWSQEEGKAIVGPLTGTKLTWLSVVNTTFAAFKKQYPKGQVLKGPYPARAYARDPYEFRGYYRQDRPGMGIDPSTADRRMHQKAIVSGVMLGDTAFCIPHAEAKKLRGPSTVVVAGQTLTISYDASTDVVSVTKKLEDGTQTPVVVRRAFWFAWQIFHPKTKMFEASKAKPIKPAAGHDDGAKPDKPQERGSEDFE